MPGYTHKNLKQVKDMAPTLGADAGFEARFARGELDCERSGMTYYRYEPGTRTPFGHRRGPRRGRDRARLVVGLGRR